jgi:hypothetical protein
MAHPKASYHRPVQSGSRRPRPLKLDPALLCVRGLLNRDHLPLHLSKLGRSLLVAADEEGRRPEDDDGRCGGQAVIGALLVLRRPGQVANGLRLVARRAAALGLLQSGITREGIGPRTIIPKLLITARAVLIFALMPVTFADDLTGQASIIDGDTLEIHGTRIRLWGMSEVGGRDERRLTGSFCRCRDRFPDTARYKLSRH